MASKLEEGKFKGAVGLACAVDVLADHLLDTLEALKRKHLEAHLGSSIMPPHDSSLFSSSVTQLTIA